MATARFLGTTDDVTTCDCCGRTNLKSTVAISIDDADPVYYGVTCAAHALNCSAKHVRAESRRADDERERAAEERRRAAAAAESARWFRFLDLVAPRYAACYANGSRSDVLKQIESLGGYSEARLGFDALASAGAF